MKPPPKIHRPAPDVGALALVTGAQFIREAQRLEPGQALAVELTGPTPYAFSPLKGLKQQRVGTAAVCRHCRAQVLTYCYPQLGLEAHTCQCLAAFMRAQDRPALSARVWSDLVRDVTVATVAEQAAEVGEHGGGN